MSAMLRQLLLLVTVVCFAGAEPVSESPAVEAWQLGQKALQREEYEQAIGQFQLSLRLDPRLVQSHLSLAAAHLAHGDEEEALGQLDRYAQARPDHLSVRLQHADLLLRLERRSRAREQFERIIEVVQSRNEDSEHLIHCHTRLMTLAEQEGDEYGMHLHRGIGLYYLACKRGELKEEDGPSEAEALLCRAAAELTLARKSRPENVRPSWYLHAVWDRLAQPHLSRRWLRAAAKANSPLSDLTPVERRDLTMAEQQMTEDGRKK